MKRTDYWIILLIIALCGLFYWRLFTFNDADALSFTDIDFTTIFTPWTSYSVERFHDGELPLWNPYMYGGTPFMADPQSAVFYPIRWLTITALALDSDITNGDVLFALQGEMLLHVVAGALFMYAFLRQRFPPLPSFIGALIWTFAGFMTSYPPAQLSILESSIWIPLVLLGIHRMRGVGGNVNWRWVMAGGVFFGLGILAGHPQISMMIAYLAAAYLIRSM
ncbi:MAG: YfhO family protein [Chloroflexi bacterium]|nr:YfhO family protein [Chloroflexota bacterium]